MTSAQSNLHLHLIPDLPDSAALAPHLQRIDAQRWYTNYGPLVLDFEAGLKALLQTANPGLEFALTTLSTGYHALELGLRALGLPTGAKVLVPAVTFPACPLAVRHAGLTPVLADIDPQWQLTPAIARAAVKQQGIAAVMPVAVYGVPVVGAAWDAFVQETGVPVIIDAAAAVEIQQLPRHCLVAHSLHATKPFGIGEGGALVGCDAALIARVRQLSNFGTVERIAQDWGTNAKLSEFHGAVGLAQLARWTSIKAKRRVLLAQYQHALAGLPLKFQPGIAQAVPSLLMLDVAPKSVAAVRAALQAQGIATHQTYLPALYRHPAFAQLDRVTADGTLTETCPQAEYLAAHVVGVPFHPFMTSADIATVTAALQAALA